MIQKIHCALALPATLLAGALLCGACTSSEYVSAYRPATFDGGRVEMTAAWDAHPDPAVAAVLAPYREEVDRVMSPVIGRAAVDMVSAYPESRLGNLVADVLRASAATLSGEPVDVGLMNVYGIRASLAQGNITYGAVYAMLPFENTLCIVTLTGAELRELFTQIVQQENMNLSGARLTADREGHLINATVGGHPLQDDRLYRLATIDYVAEGNDGMTVLGQTDRKQPLPEALLRDVFTAYVQALHQQGKAVIGTTDGRITIQ